MKAISAVGSELLVGNRGGGGSESSCLSGPLESTGMKSKGKRKRDVVERES